MVSGEPNNYIIDNGGGDDDDDDEAFSVTMLMKIAVMMISY